MKASLLFLAFAALAVVASAKLFTVFETPAHAPAGWTHVGRAEAVGNIRFTVALKNHDMKVLEKELLEISNPKSPRYGQWWHPQQMHDVIAPSIADQMRVQNWLESFGMSVSRHGDFQIVVGDVSQVEAMLKTRFLRFQHTSGKTVDRVIQYTIPAELEDIIVMVSGLSAFPVQRRTPRVSADDTLGKIVPETIWDLYGIPSTQEIKYLNSSVCLVEFQGDRSYSTTDLTTFEQETLLPEIIPDHIVGAYKPKFPDTEASLDVQYAIGISENASTWYWTTTGWLYDFTSAFLATDPVPYVVSMSWGWTEVGQCDIGACNGLTSEQYTLQTNDQFMQITMRGVTLCASSGDQGAPGDGNYNCKNTATPLSSIFPGASQWILSVGATMLDDPSPNDPKYNYQSPICKTMDCSTSRTEKVCSYPDALITTGGGFSTYLTQPDYQKAVVSAYLNSSVILPASKDYNATNRAFPDVSAVGHNYLVNILGSWFIVDGTSASSPVWAGIITRLNAYRLSNNLPSLGFVNPLIYQMSDEQPTTFKSIDTGDNRCTESCCVLGYNSAPGWDPVTGLGVPNYPAIWNYVTSLKN